MRTSLIYFTVAFLALMAAIPLILATTPREKPRGFALIFVSQTIGLLFIFLCAQTLPLNAPLATFLLCFGLLLFYGVFPFNVWLQREVQFLPTFWLWAHFLLWNAVPWIFLWNVLPSLNTIRVVTVFAILHVILFGLRLIFSHPMARQLKAATIMLNGVLPVLLLIHYGVAFVILCFGQLFLVRLSALGEKSDAN